MAGIDYDKIIALHNAGWSSAKIADEMCMTEDEYYDAITDRIDVIDAKIGALEREYRKYVALVISCPQWCRKRRDKGNEID